MVKHILEQYEKILKQHDSTFWNSMNVENPVEHCDRGIWHSSAGTERTFSNSVNREDTNTVGKGKNILQRSHNLQYFDKPVIADFWM